MGAFKRRVIYTPEFEEEGKPNFLLCLNLFDMVILRAKPHHVTPTSYWLAFEFTSLIGS